MAWCASRRRLHSLLPVAAAAAAMAVILLLAAGRRRLHSLLLAATAAAATASILLLAAVVVGCSCHRRGLLCQLRSRSSLRMCRQVGLLLRLLFLLLSTSAVSTRIGALCLHTVR